MNKLIPNYMSGEWDAKSDRIIKSKEQALKEHSSVRLYSEGEVRHFIDMAREYYDAFTYTVDEIFKSVTPKESEVSQGEYDNIQAGNGDYIKPFEKFSLLPETSNPIATDHTTINPIQESEVNANFLSKECEKHFWVTVEHSATGQETYDTIQCAYCGANKENNFQHKEQPQQESIEKKELQTVFVPTTKRNAKYVLYSNGESPNSLNRMGKCLSIKAYLYSELEHQKANNSLEELEKWVKEMSCGRHDMVIHIDDLLTKIQSLKNK